jgi:phosphatidylglycerol:prolipoprotein diacylglycerol transferase
MYCIIGGVLIGGRLGYVLLYAPMMLIRHPLELFCIWHGGMSSHGGFAGVTLSLLLFAKRQRIAFSSLADVAASVAPLGIFLGRIANFINGEVYGRVTSAPWGIIFPRSVPAGYGEFVLPRHPSQLYEALLEGVLLFCYCQLRFWKGKFRPGQLAGEFLIFYSIVRIFCEFFREPDAPTILSLSAGQFYSLFLLALGLGYYLLTRKMTANGAASPSQKPHNP